VPQHSRGDRHATAVATFGRRVIMVPAHLMLHTKGSVQRTYLLSLARAHASGAARPQQRSLSSIYFSFSRARAARRGRRDLAAVQGAVAVAVHPVEPPRQRRHRNEIRPPLPQQVKQDQSP
jgi:hypothetical protein